MRGCKQKSISPHDVSVIKISELINKDYHDLGPSLQHTQKSEDVSV